MIKSRRRSECGAALIVVLALVAMMVILVVTFFASTSSESAASQHQADAAKAQQLASSAAQMVIAQIQDASTRTTPGAGNAVAWTSQPGLLRTFTPGGPSTVFKLYSAGAMVTDSFGETDDVPPANWKSSPALFCDINAPVPMAGSGRLSYPVADPAASGVVPGFETTAAPGYEVGSTPAPDNNPLPMPVQWLYILKDGQIAVPESVATGGTVLFSTTPQPSGLNPVVGRIAFWTDDETCKVNINTAGYARNDDQYWTYWDTPAVFTRDENKRLSFGQPWTREYARYPGHPATTGVNVVFEPLTLSDEQVLSLNPYVKHGGTRGGSRTETTAPTIAQLEELEKEERLYATVDELFYTPVRGLNAVGISAAELEARRFLLTATSRAPETTLFDTPRVTIWPTWADGSKRSATDRLIAFTSTIAGQPFYFVRQSPLDSNELLGIDQNKNLWDYLEMLSKRNLPGFGGHFLDKYDDDRNQILTSLFDAVRLTNLDDRSGPGEGTNTAWSFIAGELRPPAAGQTRWAPVSTSFTDGYVAPTAGPSGTRAAGRAPALAEVAFLFARPTNSGNLTNDPRDSAAPQIPQRDLVKSTVLLGFFTPSAGMTQPGQRRRVVVSGLNQFRVRADASSPWQRVIPQDSWDITETDGNNATRRFMGGRIEWSTSRRSGSGYGVPRSSDLVLPFDEANPNANPFEFSGGALTVEVYQPENAPTPFQRYEINFDACSALTPEPVMGGTGTSIDASYNWVAGSRWVTNLYEERVSGLGDTIIAMQSPTGDYRSEILRQDTIADFQPHRRYGKTDILPTSLTNPPLTAGLARWLSRRASSILWQRDENFGVRPEVNDLIFGRMIADFNGYRYLLNPVIPSRDYAGGFSVQETFPPGDFSSGPGIVGSGSLSPKSDEGARMTDGSFGGPYFQNVNITNEAADGTLASPNRQVPSAVFFGSIPSGEPWRTLLFRPARSYHSGGIGHFGSSNPPDYLMLDWFHMPVVEPYAISEPFSTAGKINLNSKIIPFGGYLRRETALHAVLESVRIAALPEAVTQDASNARVTRAGTTNVTTAPDIPTRWPVDAGETLDLLRDRFTAPGGSNRHVYLTAGEICSVDLVPEGFTAATLPNFWANKRVTGDNLREQPYSSLVPRLTARSNSYTVHVTAQVLKPAPGVVGWQEGRGAVTGEWRGAITLERYVDPNDQRFETTPPDFLSGTEPVGPYYKFRILGTRRFNP